MVHDNIFVDRLKNSKLFNSRFFCEHLPDVGWNLLTQSSLVINWHVVNSLPNLLAVNSAAHRRELLASVQ